MKEDEETDVIILLLSMIYRYLNSLLLKFSIRYFSYINGCHTVIIPLFITPPPLPRIFLFPVSTKKRHIKYGKNIIMSVLLKTIVADYSATAGTINTVNQVNDCE